MLASRMTLGDHGDLYVFTRLAKHRWFRALVGLEESLRKRDKDGATRHYAALFRALAEAGRPDLTAALADALVFDGSSLADAALAGEVPDGLKEGALLDLGLLLERAGRSWTRETERLLDRDLPPLALLAPGSQEAAEHDTGHDYGPAVTIIEEALPSCDAAGLFDALLERYRRQGTGPLARFLAFRWSASDKSLVGIGHPSLPDAGRLVDVTRQLALLRRNTEAFLARRPAQHTLLYGPRGSGKSTAVRSLLRRHGGDGLRLVELSPGELNDLPLVIERLRPSPHRFILFVDDLSFEADSSRYGPLKTLLEGSLTERPPNVLVYATSNRRHLVGERFSERPDPLSDDVHGWDSQHEKLALSDRFGLTVTFPDATQTRYLQIVGALAQAEGLALADLEARAVRFAEWGNGYSGRTAQQFIETVKAGLA